MTNFLVLLARLSSFLMFIILEIISFYLIVKHNNVQREIYLNSSNIFSGTAYGQVDKATRFFNLGEYADSLSRDNARLLALVGNHQYFNTLYTDTVQVSLDTSAPISPRDTVPSKDVEAQFSFIAARVVNNSIAKANNFLTIDRGSNHGIKVGMGVIGKYGSVGIVRSVSAHYAQVMSVLHKQTNISAIVKRNHYFGSLVWKDNDPRYMNLETIPKYTDLQKGDSVMTSGFSTKFPIGLPLGVIEKVWVESGSNFFSASVRLHDDMANIKYVYVVNNLFAAELEALDSTTAILNQVIPK